MVFQIPIDKDVVRRILAHHYLPGQDSGGPSWLTFLGHMRDSLWSMDLFRCESAMLRTHWVLVVMDVVRAVIQDEDGIKLQVDVVGLDLTALIDLSRVVDD